MVRKIGKLFNIFKIFIIPSFWLIFDDVIFEYIVINYFSKTYFCTILFIIKFA